jgi:hypothetical protein
MAAQPWEDFIREWGLQKEKSRIFGWVNGFFITFGLQLGTMRLHVFLPPAPEAPNPEGQGDALRGAEAVLALESDIKAYGLSRISTWNQGSSIGIMLRGNTKTFKMLGAYITGATAKLAALFPAAQKTCAHCQAPLTGPGVPVRIRWDIFPMHDHCADALAAEAAWHKEPPKGRLLPGILGAALFALAGAVPWAAVYALGYMTSLVGILIGFLINKGYDLLGGRQSRAKVAVVLLFIFLSVALGHAAGMTYHISKTYDELTAGLPRDGIISRLEFVRLTWEELLRPQGEALGEMIRDYGLGVFFALLGCSGTLLQVLRNTAPAKPKRLTATV